VNKLVQDKTFFTRLSPQYLPTAHFSVGKPLAKPKFFN